MEYFIIFLWFLSGVIFQKAMSSLIDFGILSIMMEKITKDLLISIVFVEQDEQFVIESKKLILKEKGMTDEDIEHYTLIHSRNFKMWREKIIITLINNFPQTYRKTLLPFNNWEGAVKYVNQLLQDQKHLANRN